MRALVVLLLVCTVSTLHADEKAKGPLAEARSRWLNGNYAEARELYEAKAKEEKLHNAATIGIARTHISEGNHVKALEALDAALKKSADDADLLAARADVLYQTGRWDDALEAAENALKIKTNHFAARWVRARLLRDRGKMAEADAEMRWFVRTYTQRSNNDDDIKDPDELLIVGQAGAENARWHNLSDQFRFILVEVYGDVLKFEPECWIAEYLAGAMLLEKYNRPEALKAFNSALKLNPRAAEAFVGKGQAALQTFEIKDAEQFAEQALKINPRLTSALRLRADVHLLTGDIAAALKMLDRAWAVNAREEATLARQAACHLFLKQPAEFDKVVADVKTVNPKPGVFYTELAGVLEDRKYYTQAEKYFKEALELNEKLSGPKSGLGMLYLRLGREAEARPLLDKAFDADRFNVRVANSLKVLRHLEKYETKESKHYILRYDPKTDRILAEFVLDFLEEVHAKLAKEFVYEPEGKTLFELFNTHEMFSGRTVALPDLHTIGACTGRVVTMVSPRGKGLAKMFNWSRVIRHELVHIFNLAQTDFQVPHWLTEGLAVRNEGGSRPPSWDVVLREKHQKGELMNLDTIQLGFVRPRSPDEWTLAYCQSLLYVEYLIKAHGVEAIGKLLAAYQAGFDTTGALKKACQVDKSAFEKGYREHVDAIIKSIPGELPRSEKSLTLAELEALHEKKPDDAEVAAQLAREYVARKRSTDANQLLEQILEKNQGHPLASIVKARLLIAGGDEAAGRRLIGSAVAINGKDIRLRAFLGRLCLESKEFAAAAEQFEQCRALAPLGGDWLEQLRSLYTKLEETDKLVKVLRDITSGDPDDLQARLQLAKLYLDAKKYPEAETMARDSLHIDVLNKEGRDLLLEALKAQKKTEEAEKLTARFAEE